MGLESDIERIQLQVAAAKQELGKLPSEDLETVPADLTSATAAIGQKRFVQQKRDDLNQIIAQFKQQLDEKHQQLNQQRQRQRQQEARFRIDRAISEVEDIAAELRDLAAKQRELLLRANALTQQANGDFLILNPRPPYPDSINHRNKQLVISDARYIPSAPAIIQGDSQCLFQVINQAI